MNVNIIIETERLVLRPLTLEDAETVYYGWTGDAEVSAYVNWLPHHSLDEAIEWIKKVEWKRDENGNIEPNDNYIWGFAPKDTGELLGSGGLVWRNERQAYQMNYNIMKKHWGHGYTTEAMRAILRFAAENLGVTQVVGGHAKENPASGRVLEKLGFVYQKDGIMKHVDGKRSFESKDYLLDLTL
jgi:ribosomal-protein-alanine N-acetyltransferase